MRLFNGDTPSNDTSQPVVQPAIQPVQLWKSLVGNCQRRASSPAMEQAVTSCCEQQHLMATRLFQFPGACRPTESVDLFELIHVERQRLGPVLESRHTNVLIEGGPAFVGVGKEILQLTIWSLMLEAVMSSRIGGEVDVCLIEEGWTTELEIADCSDRDVSREGGDSWGLRCAAFLLRNSGAEIQVTNCPQGGVASRLILRAQSSRMAA